jgi:isopenicillin-N epimerase
MAGWREVKRGFDLDPTWVHLGTAQFLASHPRRVRRAIGRYRSSLDANPVVAAEKDRELSQAVRRAAASYFGADDPDEVCLTGNTTMGLGLLYAGMDLAEGEEILTTDHEHYSHWEAIRAACERTGARMRAIPLYEGPASDATASRLVERLTAGVTGTTRVVAATWVHSDTGLRLPVREIASRLARMAGARGQPPLLVIDATHGVGAVADQVARLGADFVAGDLHKWMYGPRGTGFLWARTKAWHDLRPSIAGFNDLFDDFVADSAATGPMTGKRFSPGGFHAFEHRWAAAECFAFHSELGRERVARRIHALNRRCKTRLTQLPRVRVQTPMSDSLSAGIVAFNVDGMESGDVVHALRRKRVLATVAPYSTAYARFTPGLINDEQDIEDGIRALDETVLRGSMAS